VPVIVAAAELPLTTVPIVSVLAGPVAPTLPAGPAAPAGPTPPFADTVELELVTKADTPLEVTVAEIGCDVTAADMSLISPPLQLHTRSAPPSPSPSQTLGMR
jgi:hypothetical protein